VITSAQLTAAISNGLSVSAAKGSDVANGDAQPRDINSRRRKSDGLTMGIPLNARSGSRCFLSPLTM
jgi:hypothetical protein